MKKSRLLILLSSMFFTLGLAQSSRISEKAIYKWEQGGLVYYSHIKPQGIDDFIKLDSSGRKVEDYTEDFGEVVQIIVRPNEQEEGGEEKADATEETKTAEHQEEEIKKKNCETARKNLAILDSGEVYERDSQGNMIRLTVEEMQNKRKNVERDVDYFCAE